MKKKTVKILSVAFVMLVFATSLPFASALNTEEQNIDETTPSSYQFFMIGIVSPSFGETSRRVPYHDGFYPVFVITNMVQRGFVGPVLGFIDGPIYFEDYEIKGYVGAFFVCAQLTGK